MEKIYKKALKREATMFGVKAWYEGESKELEKLIGFGFYNHLFHVQNGIMTLYYEAEEGDKFWEVLKEKLTEELFDDLCDNFLKLFEKAQELKDEKELYALYVKSWPALSIFDEISKYPYDLATESMIRRLIRIRKTTERFGYDIEEKINKEELKDYIYFKGRVIEMPFNDFIKENEVRII